MVNFMDQIYLQLQAFVLLNHVYQFLSNVPSSVLSSVLTLYVNSISLSIWLLSTEKP